MAVSTASPWGSLRQGSTLSPLIFVRAEIPCEFYFNSFERWHFCCLIAAKSLSVKKVRPIKIIFLVPETVRNYFTELLESAFFGNLLKKHSAVCVKYISFGFCCVMYLKCKIPGLLILFWSKPAATPGLLFPRLGLARFPRRPSGLMSEILTAWALAISHENGHVEYILGLAPEKVRCVSHHGLY